ncbi:MAG: phosphoribosyltransferase domain-containing protein [Sarcina sp.]
MEIKIEKNKYNLELNDLIVMGKRANNTKRNFLFISKLLGKHIAINPKVCKIAGMLLAGIFVEDERFNNEFLAAIKDTTLINKEVLNKSYEKKENILVLGFSETATGLGMAVASALKGSKFMTTTRENIEDINAILKFEEEHSHATTHKCFVGEKDFFEHLDRIVLVDDEITTGKSMLNIIKELKNTLGIKKYSILSILDWRNTTYLNEYSKFEIEEDVSLEVISLIAGKIKSSSLEVFEDNDGKEICETGEIINLECFDRVEHITNQENTRYIRDTGRFGTSYQKINELEKNCEIAAEKIRNYIGEKSKILVVGHGENIYIPSRVADYLGNNCLFKTTTRSPIYCENKLEYPINEKHYFYDRGVKYYFYNKESIECDFDIVIFLVETNLNIKLTTNTKIFKL